MWDNVFVPGISDGFLGGALFYNIEKSNRDGSIESGEEISLIA